MNWFKGSIPEAISSAKLTNGVFIVYIYDKSDVSKKAKESLNKEDVSRILSSSVNVAIEIENGSQDAIQFAQIYPLIVVPSLFFINPQTGIPLEVIGGEFEEKSLIEKYNKIAPKQNEVQVPKVETSNLEQSSQSPGTSSVQHSERESEEDVETPSTIEAVSSSKSEERDASHVGANDIEGASASATPENVQNEANSPTLDERVERAKKLLVEKQEEQNIERIEEEKRKELERRHQSQEVAKAKQRREEQERLQMSRQRKKDKEEDRLARERVKAQIAADKAEREARNALLRGDQPPQASAPLQQPAVAPRNNGQNNASITRIKFRFHDNSSALGQFPPEATLGDVRTHIHQEFQLPFTYFKMVGALPPQTFTEEQMSLKLTELGLTPSAIIIIKPISQPPAMNIVPAGEGIMALFWSLLAPLTFLINYVRGLFGAGTRRQGPSRSDSSDDEDLQTSKKPRTEGSYSTRNRPKTAYGRKGERDEHQRREGNIHRLNRGENDDDDDNNTWNGNSTQQM